MSRAKQHLRQHGQTVEIMHDWHPHNLVHCVDSFVLGWATVVLSVGTFFWYLLIASRWWGAAGQASPEGRAVWRWLVAIFVVCAIAGYGATTLALFWPKTAVITRLTALVLLNVVCPMFWYYASSRRFVSLSRYEALGEQLVKYVQKPPSEMGNRELDSLVREMVVESLGRKSSALKT